MNLRFLGFIQFFIGLQTLAVIVVSTHLAVIGHWGFWALLPFSGASIFIMFRWGDIFLVDNPVTRAGEGLRPFVEAMKDVDKRAEQLVWKSRSLAERCFDAQSADEELFNTIHEIMGGADLETCTDEGFVFPVDHTYVDPYDSSVEVIMNKDVPPMTREQANAILALGFGQVYESHGSDGRQWTKTDVGKCSPRDCKADGAAILAALRVKTSGMKTAVLKFMQWSELVSRAHPQCDTPKDFNERVLILAEARKLGKLALQDGNPPEEVVSQDAASPS